MSDQFTADDVRTAAHRVDGNLPQGMSIDIERLPRNKWEIRIDDSENPGRGHGTRQARDHQEAYQILHGMGDVLNMVNRR